MEKEEILRNFQVGQDPDDPTSTVHTKLRTGYSEQNSSGETLAYIRYNREVYRFKFSFTGNLTSYTMTSIPGTLEKIYTPEGNIGKYATYKGITWIVLNENSSTKTVDLISANALGQVNFQISDFNDGRTKYNDAVQILVDECKTITGISSNIRNVGGPASEDPLSADNTIVFNDLNGFTPSQTANFSQYEGETNGLRKEDTNYLSDVGQMKKIGVLYAENGLEYWMSSRRVQVGGNYVTCYLRRGPVVDAMEIVGFVIFNNANGADEGSTYQKAYAVRPIVTLSSDATYAALTAGAGTVDSQIVLE